jgi:hypothetical protein
MGCGELRPEATLRIHVLEKLRWSDLASSWSETIRFSWLAT